LFALSSTFFLAAYKCKVAEDFLGAIDKDTAINSKVAEGEKKLSVLLYTIQQRSSTQYGQKNAFE
jgi:hypothetical protein